MVAERKLNDVLISLYKDQITQNKAEQLAAAVLGLLPRETQPVFRRQFPVRGWDNPFPSGCTRVNALVSDAIEGRGLSAFR
jgi:hypothetical protein